MKGFASPSASGVGQKLFPNRKATYSAVKFFFIKKISTIVPENLERTFSAVKYFDKKYLRIPGNTLFFQR